MARLSDEKIAEIQRLYAEIGIYSQVAKQVGCSPATVKKYAGEPKVVPVVAKKFDGTIIAEDELIAQFADDLQKMARLTEEELSELHELWKEI